MNIIDGKSIKDLKRLFFEGVISNNIYFGTARGFNEDSWGDLTLLKIKLPKNRFLYSEENPNLSYLKPINSSLNNYFFSRKDNKEKYFRELKMIKINKKDLENNEIKEFENINENNTIYIRLTNNIYLEEISNEWMLVSNFNPLDFKIFDDFKDYYYYLINYNYDLEKPILIEEVKIEDFLSFFQDVNLFYLENNIEKPFFIGDLKLKINLNGEIVIFGLDLTKDDMKELISNSILQEKTYILKNNLNIPIFNNLRIKNISLNIDENYIIFENKLSEEKKILVKLTDKNLNEKKIGVFLESLPYYIENSNIIISDINPPGLDEHYLKNYFLFNSIFNINALKKIKKENIYFCKEISEDEKNLYQKNNNYIIKEYNIENNKKIYLLTQNKFIAYRENFTNIYFLINLSSNPDSEDYFSLNNYRQIFICINPKKSNGDFVINNYIEENELYNKSIGGYDLGYILYVANLKLRLRNILDEEFYEIIV